MSNTERPRYLYKYQPVSIYTLQNLKNNAIYFNNPKNFNDPFDFRHPLKVGILEDKTLQKLLFDTKNGSPFKSHFDKLHKNVISASELVDYFLFLSETFPVIKIDISQKLKFKENDFESNIREYISSSEQSFESIKSYAIKSVLQIITERVKESVIELRSKNVLSKGVSCFSEINDDILMWAYYADGHKGICLEFNTEYEPFNKLQKVKYLPEAPTIDPNLIFSDSLENMELVESLLAVKYKDWSHEREWRVIHLKQNIAYSFKPNTLSGVYFGSEMDFVNFEIIAVIIKGQNPKVKFYQMVKVPGEFKVVPKLVTYSTFQEAKDMVYPLIVAKLSAGTTSISNLMEGIEIGATKDQLHTIIEAIIDDMKDK